MEAIYTKSLTKKFGTLVAVDSLDLTVNYGEIFSLIGPDGSGKTTIMRLLSSIMSPTSGEAWVAGYHLLREAEIIKKNIGYMGQQLGLYHDLSVIENVEFYADIYGLRRKERKERIDYLLSFFGLVGFRKQLCGHLSGGMKQKLGLACGLIHSPKILLLDEPTTGLDPVSRRDFWQFLYWLAQQKITIFISTAYLNEAERCSQLALIYQGCLLACGKPDEIKALMPGHILELIISQPIQAKLLLEKNPDIISATMFGNSLHLYTSEPAKTIHYVKDILTTAGIHVEDSRIIEPQLEDVFVWMMAKGKIVK